MDKNIVLTSIVTMLNLINIATKNVWLSLISAIICIVIIIDLARKLYGKEK